jgi:hypothetical protein
MEVMNCTEEQRVKYVTFYLTAEVERWWTAQKEHLQQGLGVGVTILRRTSRIHSWSDSFLKQSDKPRPKNL